MGDGNINGTSTYTLVRELAVEVKLIRDTVQANSHDLKAIKWAGGIIITTVIAMALVALSPIVG